jgi:transposase
VECFLQKHSRLHLSYLPRYQPGLNPQEQIWKQARYEATTNRWFENLELIWLAILRTVGSWSPKKIRRLCNIS